MSTTSRGFHRLGKKPLPLGRAVVGQDIEPLVRDVCRRIRQVRNSTQAGAYVLADDEGSVYVLQEVSIIASRFARAEKRLCVGLYEMDPGEQRMQIDLVSHLFRIGYLDAGAIYGEVQRG